MHGKAKAYHPRVPGLVGVSDVTSWDFLYRHSTIQDPKFFVGDRVVLPDGRVNRYAKASNIISSCKFGVKFWNQIGDGVAAVLAQGQSVGDRSIYIVAAGVTEDEFRGGYVLIHVGTHQQFRGVLGNTATDANGRITVYLDAVLTYAVTNAHWTEILHNPYSNVRLTAGPSGGDAGNDYSSVAGIPNVATVEANEYLWLQTWGPIWINPHGGSLQDAGITGGERKLVFDCEGSVCVEDDVAHGPGADGDEHQLAGFIIDRSADGSSGPPLVMLQISP